MENTLIELPKKVQERINKEAQKELDKSLAKLDGLLLCDKMFELKNEFKKVYSKGESKLWFMADAKDKKIAELTEIIQKRAK